MRALNAGSLPDRLHLFSRLRRVKQSHLRGEDIDAAASLRAFAEEALRVGLGVHRMVHGGARLHAASIASEEVEAQIRRAARLAPLHNPLALRWNGCIWQRTERDGPAVLHQPIFFTEGVDAWNGFLRTGFSSWSRVRWWRCISSVTAGVAATAAGAAMMQAKAPGTGIDRRHVKRRL